MVAHTGRVLVVDDEQIVRDSCERVLRDAGYTVRTAGNGHDALKACRDAPVDVMLTDLKMPDMQGLDVIRAVAKEFPQVRVVIITGYPSRETALQAGRLGVFDYLEKPLSPERLNAATAGALAEPPAPASTAPAPEAPSVIEPEADKPEGCEVELPPNDEAGDSGPTVELDPGSPAETPDGEPFQEIASKHAVKAQPSVLKGLTLLAVAPLIALAYVVFVPLIGFGMLFVAIAARLLPKSS
jgi:CheY-like chemotaxis protein